jgi:hypothetical protein
LDFSCCQFGQVGRILRDGGGVIDMSNATTGPTQVEGARRGVTKAFRKHSVLSRAEDYAKKEMACSESERKHFALVVSVFAHALSLILLFIFNTLNVLNDYTMAVRTIRLPVL